MASTKCKYVVWLIPIFYLGHIAEEFFAGAGFFEWFSEFFPAELSEMEYLTITIIGLVFFFLFSFYQFTVQKYWSIVLACGSFLFFNGCIHVAVSISSLSYIPGSISGLLLFLPLGYILYRCIWKKVSEKIRFIAILGGIIAHFIVAAIAMTI